MTTITGGLGSNSTLNVTIGVSGPQLNTVNQGITSLLGELANPANPNPSVNISTFGGGLTMGGRPQVHAVPGAVNIKNGVVSSGFYQLGAHWAGAIVTGTNGVELVGRPGSGVAGDVQSELLVGNNGADTIKGGGGSGTIVSGSGTNLIHTGGGDLVVDSGGTDNIKTGKGIDNVEARGTATVHAGSGFTIFTDKGTGSSTFKVAGGTGVLVAYSGLGNDTFVGGSGFNLFQDSHTLNGQAVTFKFKEFTGGTTVIQGFQTGVDHVELKGFDANLDALGKVTVASGNSYLDLGGTRIEFVGVTNLAAGDFTS